MWNRLKGNPPPLPRQARQQRISFIRKVVSGDRNSVWCWRWFCHVRLLCHEHFVLPVITTHSSKLGDIMSCIKSMWSVKAWSALAIVTWTVNKVDAWSDWESTPVPWDPNKVDTGSCWEPTVVFWMLDKLEARGGCWPVDLMDPSRVSKASPGVLLRCYLGWTNHLR